MSLTPFSLGFFNLVSGIAMLVASVLAGLLWDAFGAAFTFYAGAGFCLLTLLLLANSKAQLA